MLIMLNYTTLSGFKALFASFFRHYIQYSYSQLAIELILMHRIFLVERRLLRLPKPGAYD